MVEVKKGNKKLTISISQEAAELLDQQVTSRKRGEVIAKLILKEYASKNEVASTEKLLESIPIFVLEEYLKARKEKESSIEVK